MSDRQEVQKLVAALDVFPTNILYLFLAEQGCTLNWVVAHIYEIVFPAGVYKEPLLTGPQPAFTIHFPDGCSLKERPYRDDASALHWNNDRCDGQYGP